MIYTTLNKIRAHGPCGLKPNSEGELQGLCKLLAHLGKTTTDDEPVSFATILESNGLDDALWCLRSVPEEYKRWRLLAVKFARTVQHLMTDARSPAALDVAERHANGQASDDELYAAGAAARAAARDAWAAARDAGDAAVAAAGAAAGAAAWDAWAAAWDAAGDAAVAAAGAAARDAWAAAWDAWAAAWDAWAAAWDAAGDDMEKIFLAALED